MLEKITSCLHDMNNKLSIVLGTTVLVKRMRCQDCRAAEMLDAIHEASLGMSDIIVRCRQKLNMCKKDEMSKLDIYNLFQPESELHKEVSRVATEMLLTIEITNRLSLGCSILVSSTMLDSCKQIINNLFFNAKKANATVIRIVAVEHTDYVAVHLIDNGDGMSAETLACLGLAIASKTSTGEGTRIVKKLAAQEGMVIEWSSPGVGAGCCVTMRMTKYKEAT